MNTRGPGVREARLFAVGLIGFLFTVSGRAAVTLDGTFGTPGPLAGPDYVIPDSVGHTRGNNLFHSFGQFNLTSSESATFTGPANIQNVIGRVTGGASTIDGRISSQIAGANLYFINPSGIVFGPNASLDVSGSFHASTADYLRLADGGIFHASNPGASNLTLAPPAAFGFLASSAAAISVQRGSNALQVSTGQTLSLVGGNIDIVGPGGFGTATLAAPGGRINLVSVASPGELAHLSGDLDTGSFATLGDVRMSNAAFVSVAGDPGGTLAIRAGKFTMDFSATTSANNAAIDHPGVGTDIRVRGDMVVQDSEIASTSFGAGRAGAIVISADALTIAGGTAARPGFPNGTNANIGSRARSTGRGGDTDITARSITIRDRGSLNNNSLGAGRAGDIRIRATDFRIDAERNGSARVSNGAFGSGNAGDISISARNVSLAGSGGSGVGISTQAQPSTGNPNAGTLRIDATTLEIRNGAQISAAVFAGAGNGGRVEVNADTVHIAGIGANGAQAGLFAATLGSTTTGNGGSIAVNADSLVVADGGQVSTFSSSRGDAGNIALAVRDLTVSNGGGVTTTSLGGPGADAGHIQITADSILLNGPTPAGAFTGVFAVAGSFAGNAGNIGIATGTLTVMNGAEINSRTTGAGAGGAIDITADKILLVGSDPARAQGSRIDASTEIFGNFAAQSTGRGGDVRIRAGLLELRDGGTVSVRSTGQGNAGNITVDAREVRLTDGGAVTTAAAQADGGNITINAQRLLYLADSSITASVQGGTGNGGNIRIDPDFVVLKHSRIAADAVGGNGGNVSIVAGQFLASPDSSVSASSTLGIQGSVVIRAPGDDVSGELAQLPETALDAAARFKSTCSAVGSRFSSFTVAVPAAVSTGTGFIPSSYGDIGPVADVAGGPSAAAAPSAPPVRVARASLPGCAP